MSVNKVNADGSLTRIAGRGTVEYGASTVRSGSVSFSANPNTYTIRAITFSEPMPDSDYLVELEIISQSNAAVHITSITSGKTKNGFSIVAYNSSNSADSTLNVRWTAFKLFTVEGLSDLESNVTGLQAVVPSGASASNQLVTENDLNTSSRRIDVSNANSGDRGYKYVLLSTTSENTNTTFFSGMGEIETRRGGITNSVNTRFSVMVGNAGNPYKALVHSMMNENPSLGENLCDVVTLTYGSVKYVALKVYVYDWSHSYVYIRANYGAEADWRYKVVSPSEISNEVSGTATAEYLNGSKLIAQSDLTSTVTSGSSAPITSGGVFSALNTVTSGTATNTSNVSSGACTWVKIGRIATVTLNAYTPVAYTGGDRQLATGLPKPVAYTAWGIQSVDGTVNQLFSIGTDGVLMGASGSMKSGAYYQTLTYLCQA